MMIRRLLHNKVVVSIGLCCAIVLLGDASGVAAQAVQTGSIPVSLPPTKTLPVSEQLLAIGKKTYTKECAPCHGVDGRGQGEAAYLLYPKPRDFVTAQYRLVSTWMRRRYEKKTQDASLFYKRGSFFFNRTAGRCPPVIEGLHKM